MRLDDPSNELGRLHEAAERISANLVELELDSSRQLLEASSLEGESAARWSAASDALTELWRRHGLLEGWVARADKLHGSRRADDLRALLDGPSIELASSDVPLAERKLLGSPQTADRCSPDELLSSMSAAFDEVKTVVSRIGGAWETLIPKLAAAGRLLQEASRLAEELGESARRDLESVQQELTALNAAISTDPLSVDAGDVDRLTQSLRVIRDDLEGTATLRRGFEARILDARELLERLRTAVAEGHTAHEELLVKISVPTAPAAPEAPEAHNELETELTGIAAMAQHGAWREARRALEDWTARTAARLDDAQRTLDANRAPIAARNQFRALLEAYQVKAGRLGLLEDPRLAEIFDRAREALYNAPIDLALAAQLVRSYQQALSGSRPTPEAML
jgi:hypothetical protein